MTAVRKYTSDRKLMEENIFQQAARMMLYYEDQKGKDFDPAQIIDESATNVICRIAFGKHLDSSHPDLQELLHLHNEATSNIETNAQMFVLDFFPIAKYFPFNGYQSDQKMADRL